MHSTYGGGMCPNTAANNNNVCNLHAVLENFIYVYVCTSICISKSFCSNIYGTNHIRIGILIECHVSYVMLGQLVNCIFCC